MLPVGTELVVTRALGRVAQHFVGFVDRFELRLAGDFVFGHIRVIQAGEFAKRLLDVVRRGGAGDAERLVVILKFYGHGGD